MGRKYSVVFDSVAVTAQQDFFEITSRTTGSNILHSVWIGQSSDAGDAQDEMLSIRIRHGTSATTSGSGGSSATPANLNRGGDAAGSLAEVNNTTRMASATSTTVHCDGFNVRAGWVYRPTPEERFEWSNGSRITVELTTTPADSLTMSGALIFEEIG